MFNATITGRLGQDFTIVTTKNGKKYGEMSVAVNKSTKSADGSWKNRAIWVRVKTFTEASFENLEKRALKGASAVVTGELDVEMYDGKSGKALSVDMTASKIEIITAKDDAAPHSSNGSSQSKKINDIDDDEIPF